MASKTRTSKKAPKTVAEAQASTEAPVPAVDFDGEPVAANYLSGHDVNAIIDSFDTGIRIAAAAKSGEGELTLAAAEAMVEDAKALLAKLDDRNHPEHTRIRKNVPRRYELVNVLRKKAYTLWKLCAAVYPGAIEAYVAKSNPAAVAQSFLRLPTA